MKPTRFDYYPAESIEEAVSLLSQYGDGAKLLAGGQSLVPAMNFRLIRPAVLIDINRVTQLEQLSYQGKMMRIGSMVRHRRLEHLAGDTPTARLFRRAARHVGHLPIRIRGTFGGSLAHADPAAEWCVLALLLEGEIVTRGEAGERTIAASDFFHTTFTTALLPEELLVEARIPQLPETHRVGLVEFSRRAGDFALTIAAVVVGTEGNQVTDLRIAIGGVADRPVRAGEAEALGRGETLSTELVQSVAQTASQEVQPIADIHGSVEYRRDLVRVLTRRALEQALSL